MMRTVGFVAAALLCATRADAGLVSEHADIPYIEPFVGYEVTYLTAAFEPGGFHIATAHQTLSGLAFGGTVGFRFGPFNFGVLYQRTQVLDPSNTGLNLNKLYGEFGLDLKSGPIMGILHFDFGWAAIGHNSDLTSGFGGKVGLQLDFYLTQWLSVGPSADFDAQAYSTPNTFTGGVGGTFLGRVGFHI